MNMVSCPNCGHTVPDNAQHCPDCSQSLVRKKLSATPLFVIGAIMLLSSGVLLANYLQTGSSEGVTGIPIQTVMVTRPMTQAPTREPTSPIPPNTTTAIEEAQSTIIPSQDPIGKIVFTCQIFKDPNRNQICIMNADGSDQTQLTTDQNSNHLYPSLAPDGGWIGFTGYIHNMHNHNGCEVYIIRLGGEPQRLTNNDYCDWQPHWGQ